MFLKLDTSQDGFLTPDELHTGINEVLGTMRAAQRDWQDLVSQLDTNHDGKIDYAEFITAAVNRARLLSAENLRIAFNIFDKDNNGFISKTELMSVFASKQCQTALEDEDESEDEQLWNHIMTEVDQNQDNMISFNEFSDTMIEVINQRSSLLS